MTDSSTHVEVLPLGGGKAESARGGLRHTGCPCNPAGVASYAGPVVRSNLGCAPLATRVVQSSLWAMGFESPRPAPFQDHESPTMKAVVRTRIPDPMHERMLRTAKMQGYSMSELLRELIAEGLTQRGMWPPILDDEDSDPHWMPGHG